MQKIPILALLLASGSCALWADDLSGQDEQSSDYIEEDRNGEQGHFEFDLKVLISLHTDFNVYMGEEVESPAFSYSLVPSITLYDFFFEAPKYRPSTILGDFNLGYHALQGDQWNLDVIGGSYIGAIEVNGDGVHQGLDGLRPRKDDLSWGVRYSQFGENTFFSVDLVGDIQNKSHESWLIDTFIGYRKAIGNWDLTMGIDYLWAPSKVTNYYVGISEAEARPGRPFYKPEASSMATIEFLAEYPLSEHWVFDTGFIVGRFGTEVINSPLIAVRDFNAVLFALVYVF